MEAAKPPIFDFDRLKPVTMTIIASYDSGELNLPAVFIFMPVTDKTLPTTGGIKKKKGKIRLPPELNVPGEILSMRYAGQVRGIVRSEETGCFSHSIIIDIGTKDRIISLKVAPYSLHITGPTSFEMAKEAVDAVLGYIKESQRDMRFIRDNHGLAVELSKVYLDGTEPDRAEWTETHERIWSIFQEKTKNQTEGTLYDFMTFLLSFRHDIYTGTLEVSSYESMMVNIQFNLGFSVNQVNLANVMIDEPFICKYSNFNNTSAVNVKYPYVKQDRTTKQLKYGRHTLRVNKSGYVRHSGPNLEAMRPVYYAFMHRILTNCDKIKSIENKTHPIVLTRPAKQWTMEEFTKLSRDSDRLRERILNGEIELADGKELMAVDESLDPYAMTKDNDIIERVNSIRLSTQKSSVDEGLGVGGGSTGRTSGHPYNDEYDDGDDYDDYY